MRSKYLNEISFFQTIRIQFIYTFRGVGKFKRSNRRLCPTALYTNLVSLRIIGAFTIHYWIWTIQRIRNAKTTKYIHVWDTELPEEIEWYPKGNFISSFGRKLKITRDPVRGRSGCKSLQSRIFLSLILYVPYILVFYC